MAGNAGNNANKPAADKAPAAAGKNAAKGSADTADKKQPAGKNGAQAAPATGAGAGKKGGNKN
jgi:hypothetical protein